MSRPAWVVAVGVAALLALAPGAGAAFPGVNGRIAFERPGAGIWDVAPDGSGVRQLSPVVSDATAGCDAHPSYSPDGSLIAFDSCPPGDNILVMNADGSGRRALPPAAGEPPLPQRPVFGPGGTQLAFQGGRYSTGVFTQAIDGSSFGRVATSGYGPAWSQLGQIAYDVPFRDAEFCHSTVLEDLVVANAAGGGRRAITRSHASFDPDFSPDGSRLAYTRDYSVTSRDLTRIKGIPDCRRVARAARSYGQQVVVARADGRGARPLTRTGGRAPAFSPDGKLIAFERRPYIYVMNADGSGLRRLARGRDPAWQPLPPPPAPGAPLPKR